MECQTEPEVPTVIILDDVMSSINNSKKLEELFTRGVHHRKVSVILTLQNLFYQGSVMKTLRDNAMYIALTRHIQDVSKLDTFARQLERKNSNYFKNAYDDAVSEKYGYLFCDLHPHSDLRDGPFKIKYRSLIHKAEGQVLYLPDGKKAIVVAGGEKSIVGFGKTTLDIPFFTPQCIPTSVNKPQLPTVNSDSIDDGTNFFKEEYRKYEDSEFRKRYPEFTDSTSPSSGFGSKSVSIKSKHDYELNDSESEHENSEVSDDELYEDREDNEMDGSESEHENSEVGDDELDEDTEDDDMDDSDSESENSQDHRIYSLIRNTLRFPDFSPTQIDRCISFALSSMEKQYLFVKHACTDFITDISTLINYARYSQTFGKICKNIKYSEHKQFLIKHQVFLYQKT